MSWEHERVEELLAAHVLGGLDGDDAALARRMTVEAGVTSVPVSAFYGSNPPRSYLRLCFAKRDSVLDEAVARMDRWLKAIRRTAA